MLSLFFAHTGQYIISFYLSGYHFNNVHVQTSNAFFDAEKSYVRATIALDAGCNANFAKCNTLMQNIAYKLKQPDVCATDFTAQNPIVLQAYNGLIAYQPMYQAGCLKDSTGSYCKPSKAR
jgi:hypothetical protein